MKPTLPGGNDLEEQDPCLWGSQEYRRATNLVLVAVFGMGRKCQEERAPMTWGEIGRLMSGAGVLMTSLCAGVTVTLISLYQKRRQWVDDFRTLYAEFWNDKDISQVRRWVVSNKLYHEVLKPVLTQRIEKGYNDIDEDGSMKIDMIDKFMSLIIQL
jgi:hypothetical protein